MRKYKPKMLLSGSAKMVFPSLKALNLNRTPGIGTEKAVYYSRSLQVEKAGDFLSGKTKLSGDCNEAILRPGDNIVFVFRKQGGIKNWTKHGIGQDNLKVLEKKGFELSELYKVNAAGNRRNLKYEKIGCGRYRLLSKNAFKPSKVNPDPLGLFQPPGSTKK